VFLYSPDVLYVTSDSVKGVEIRTANNAASRFSGVEKWYVETGRILKK
jgi:hypothetical protein